jgi:hypothetical protein
MHLCDFGTVFFFFFVSFRYIYITGFFEDETLEDKSEALEGILSEVMKDDILKQCREILDKWKKVSQTAGILTGNNASSGEDTDVKLVWLLQSQP